MFRYAEIASNRVLQIYDSEKNFDTWKQLFSPEIHWIDITGLRCKKGDIISFNENLGLVFMNPEKEKVNTKKEKLTYLDYTYSANKQELAIAYVDAMMSEDTDSQASLKIDLETLNAEYDKTRAELEAE